MSLKSSSFLFFFFFLIVENSANLGTGSTMAIWFQGAVLDANSIRLLLLKVHGERREDIFDDSQGERVFLCFPGVY